MTRLLIALYLSLTSLAYAESVPLLTMELYPSDSNLMLTDDLLINGIPATEAMIDTGASYTVISEDKAETYLLNFLEPSEITLADGSKGESKVYYADNITIGSCKVENVIVMTLPNLDNEIIIGIGLLEKVSPFGFSLYNEPPIMFLSCPSPNPQS